MARTTKRLTKATRTARIIAGFHRGAYSADLASDCLLAMGYSAADVAAMLS